MLCSDGCDSYITGCGDTIGDGDRSSVGWSVYGDGLCDGFVGTSVVTVG